MKDLSALRKFARSRPGFDLRNYGSVSSYRSDVRRAGRQLSDAERLIWFCEMYDIEPDYSAYSGRLTPSGDGFDYCTGQYYPTEYRAAVAACCAKAIWYLWRDNMPAGIDNAGEYLRRKAVAEFGRGIGRRWFS